MKQIAARDTLIAVLIHSLAQELSDVRTRAEIQALLSRIGNATQVRFED